MIPRLSISQWHAFDLSACDEAAKKKRKSKEGDDHKRTTYEFGGFEIVICEEVFQSDDPVLIWYSLELE